ncbi:hypothetical protein B4Q13_22110, partial [Lacticaseibacillus rhamnosus]
MPEIGKLADLGRQRVCQVFRYLLTLDQATNVAKRHLANQLWQLRFSDLPDHPSIQLGILPDTDSDTSKRSARNATSVDD